MQLVFDILRARVGQYRDVLAFHRIVFLFLLQRHHHIIVIGAKPKSRVFPVDVRYLLVVD